VRTEKSDLSFVVSYANAGIVEMNNANNMTMILLIVFMVFHPFI